MTAKQYKLSRGRNRTGLRLIDRSLVISKFSLNQWERYRYPGIQENVLQKDSLSANVYFDWEPLVYNHTVVSTLMIASEIFMCAYMCAKEGFVRT